MSLEGYVKCSVCKQFVRMADVLHISGRIMHGVWGATLQEENEDLAICSARCLQAYWDSHGFGTPVRMQGIESSDRPRMDEAPEKVPEDPFTGLSVGEEREFSVQEAYTPPPVQTPPRIPIRAPQVPPQEVEEEDPIARKIFGPSPRVRTTTTGMVWTADDAPPSEIEDAIGHPDEHKPKRRRV